MPDPLLQRLLQLLGAGFLIANVRALTLYLYARRLRPTGQLTWRGRKPPLYGLLLALAVTLGMLLFYKLVVQHRPLAEAFGEGMMFVYYGYALPLSLRIGRGFYEEGVWTDRGYIPYASVGGLSWREGPPLTLAIIHRTRPLARLLVVPARHHAAVRRILRDKISQHDIHFTGKGLDLGDRDERDVV